MNDRYTPILIAGAAALASMLFVPPASAQAPQAGAAVQGHVNGHAFQTGSVAAVQAGESPAHAQPYDLQLHLTAGRHRADASSVHVVILGARGDKVFELDQASALTDVALPTGYYEVLADFNHSKRMAPVEVTEGQVTTLYLHGADEPN